MMWGNNFGMGWGWLFGALMMVGVVVLIFVLFRMFGRSRRDQTDSGAESRAIRGADKTPRQILDGRYAAGDLSTEEYLERLRVLGSGS
jgi:putative membrane protein